MDLTSHGFMVSAVEAVETIRDAHRRRAFAHSVDRFADLLVTLPDYAAADFAEDDIGRIRMLAEDVIALVEERAAAESGSPRTEMALVSAVYAIRKRLEAIDTWRHHADRRP